jgi:hypothetical protein
MEIGCPTDVKHVAHIGWGSSSMGSASPSWVKTRARIQHNTTGFMLEMSEYICVVLDERDHGIPRPFFVFGQLCRRSNLLGFTRYFQLSRFCSSVQKNTPFFIIL